MFMILSACALTVFVLREQIVSIFINDGQVVAEGKRYLYYFLAGVPFYGIFSGINAAFRGSGHNIPSMALDISRLWVLRIPLTYTLGIALGGGPTGVWTGMALSNIIGGCAAIGLFRTGIWKRPVIDC